MEPYGLEVMSKIGCLLNNIVLLMLIGLVDCYLVIILLDC